ncbi:DUF427 domain-containing protein [Vallicoccus soli]|uniref:DUF427 domain-containing protein n=1 Tax=Vallicoccus soli TaxID=2339232 RepID=A0A3A3Z451_9ACTN|nr:DUF427 domain-containing protein [Vallicoccus soli]RJK96396.1 DUF427 domain-containing protein [Vallicoccus soli]
MSLTLGTGPLAPTRAGVFDRGTVLSGHPLYLEDVPQRVRGYLDGECVVDSRRVRMLHEVAALPVWWFPAEDVRAGVLAPSGRTRDDDPKGALRLLDARRGGRVVEDAAYDVPEPAALPALAGLVQVRFGALDRWLEEDDEVVGHPRDPYHRVDTRRSGEHVVVRVGGEVVADSTRPVKLFETGLPPRWYLPREDVRAEHLRLSPTTTVCPYKGVATYATLTAGGTVVEDGAWSYEEPFAESEQVRGLLSFLGGGVEVSVDGEPAPGTS